MTRAVNSNITYVEGGINAGGDVAVGNNAKITKAAQSKTDTIIGIIGLILTALGLVGKVDLSGPIADLITITIMVIGICLVVFATLIYLRRKRKTV